MSLLKKVIRSMLEHKARYIGSMLLLTISSMMFVMTNNTSIVVMVTYEFAKLMCRKKVARIPMNEALKAGAE